MRLKLICCGVFESEAQAVADRSQNRIDIELLDKAPHQLSPAKVLEMIQARLDRNDRSQYHALLLVAGGCKQGLAGLQVKSIPLVIPRAKDCISLLLERPRPAWRPSPEPRSDQVRGGPSCSLFPEWGGVQAEPKYWAVPVDIPEPSQAPGLGPDSWNRRGRLHSRLNPAGPKRPQSKVPVSVMEMLVEGYWNYDDFLVVPPGWRLTVDGTRGTIAAEECSL